MKLRYSRNMRIILEALVLSGTSATAVELADLCVRDASQEAPVAAHLRAQVRRSVKRALRALADRGDVSLSYSEDPGFVSSSRNWRQKVLRVRLTEGGRDRVARWRGVYRAPSSESEQVDRLLGGGWG